MANTETEERQYPAGDDTADPPYLHADYRSTVTKSPSRPLIPLDHTVSELTGPVFDADTVSVGENDLLSDGEGLPLGERIVVTGRVLDEDGKPYAGALVEMWQANASGRYRHNADGRDAPLDPNFVGAGRYVTGADGAYSFETIRPGAYPVPDSGWWRPAHLHFSVTGPSLMARLVTQMYFPGDPLLELDAIYMSIEDRAARERLIARFDSDLGVRGVSLGYEFDIVLRGRANG
ncbi:MAG: protocatechuate 3,4-dioxygenase subunit beta [Alphaproteobacteria bacterium]|nr:protocatechuate 3,4-dioxygenase subunit beta [Alphaproteobacteria bacterium]